MSRVWTDEQRRAASERMRSRWTEELRWERSKQTSERMRQYWRKRREGQLQHAAALNVPANQKDPLADLNYLISDAIKEWNRTIGVRENMSINGFDLRVTLHIPH